MSSPAPLLTPLKGQSGLHPAIFVVSWIVTSNLTILFNKWVIDGAGFAIILTTIHLFVASALTQILARFTGLIARPKAGVTARVYIRCILPIGVLYTLSLLCSNLAYVTLSVSFISMLKALAPVTTLLISWVANFTDPSTGRLVNVLIIAFGVLLSSIGELTFAWTGFLFQMIGTVAESSRLLLIQWLLTTTPGQATASATSTGPRDEEEAGGPAGDVPQDPKQEAREYRDHAGQIPSERGASGGDLTTHGEQPPMRQGQGMGQRTEEEARAEAADASAVAAMSPLVLLYYYAPVCALLNCCTALLTEVPRFRAEDLEKVGIGMLVLNGGVAFFLNVSSVFLIGKTSALTMNLTGILKSLLLVAASVLIWATPITLVQAVGYGIALAGMFYYALPPDSPAPHKLLFARIKGGFSDSPGGRRLLNLSIPLGGVSNTRGGYSRAPGSEDPEDEVCFILEDDEDEDKEDGAVSPVERKQGEQGRGAEKLAAHED